MLALGEQEGLAAFESDERLLSYPVIVRVSLTDSTVLIDKVKERRVRPSLLVRTLRTLQDRPPRFKAGAFLEALAAAYDFTVAQAGGRAGATAKLVDVYAVLTLMPGAARDYSKQEFARDLYLLDHTGMLTKNGRTLSLPGKRAHPRLGRSVDGDPLGPSQGVRRNQFREGRRMSTVEQYVDFLAVEYLADFIPGGGATVKFVVPGDDDRADALSAGLLKASTAAGFSVGSCRRSCDPNPFDGSGLLRHRPSD